MKHPERPQEKRCGRELANTRIPHAVKEEDSKAEETTENSRSNATGSRIVTSFGGDSIESEEKETQPASASDHRLEVVQGGLVGGAEKHEEDFTTIKLRRNAPSYQIKHSLLEKTGVTTKGFKKDRPKLEGRRTGIDKRISSGQIEHVRRPLEALRPLYRTIHILGSGPTGQYIAHSLASLPNPPPVTLLVHRPLLIQQWQDEGQAIRLLRHGKILEELGIHIASSAPFKLPRQEPIGFDTNPDHSANAPENVIDHLIVTTPGSITTPALSNIKHRLRPHSTICFIADGLGIVEELNSSIFTQPLLRPNYMLGSISHVLLPSPEAQFAVIEKYAGDLSLTMLPRPPTPPRTNYLIDGPLVRTIDHGWSASSLTSTYLMRTLTRASDLNAVGLSMEDYLENQLEKVAVKAVLGPISAVFDCSNNQLLSNYQASRTMRLLLEEISLILRSLPESRRMSNAEDRFSAQRLESKTLSTIVKAGNNITSMLQDVREGNKTEIDYYNGYLAMRAAELKIDCPHNEMLISMVKAKQAIRSREKNMYIPFIDL